MNEDPQLIIFEPFIKPRTVILKVIEDINAALPVIFDEYGHEVTHYKVLYDETQSTVSSKEEIIAYIKKWESQGNAIDEKKARKLAKRKRQQLSIKEKKARNKKRKVAMKSLIHSNLDSSPLANTNVEEERAILRAMKSKKQSIKSILNIKPNRIINCNTNIRPFENSTIEIGSKKTPIDVVVLDSDEESDSDNDDLKININTPQPISTRRRRNVNIAVKSTSHIRKAAVTAISSMRKQRNRKYEVVKIDDSSDSDIECISCEEFIQSLSDDDNDENNASTSNKERLRYINVEDEPTIDATEMDCVVPVDEEASNELISMVDSFYNKYIQSAVLPLTEIVSQTDSEFPASQLVITEPISLPSNPAPVIIEPLKTSNIASKKVITEPEILRPAPKEWKNSHEKQVTFYNEVRKKAILGTESTIIEKEPVNDLVQLHSHGSDADEEAESGNESENLNEFEQVSEDDTQRKFNVLEFDSIPSPDYAPTGTIPATASNMKAFADFLRSQKVQDIAIKKSEPEHNSPVELEEFTPTLSNEITIEPNNPCSQSFKCDLTSCMNKCHPWQKCNTKKSNEIAVVEQPPVNHVQSIPSWQKPRDSRNDEIETMEHTVSRNRPSQPWHKNHGDKSDEVQVAIRDQPPCSQKKRPVSVITRPVRANQVCFKSFQKSAFSPGVDDIGGRENQRLNPSSAFSHHGGFSANSPASNSAVNMFDKKVARIGEPQSDLEKGSRSQEYCEEEYDVEPADYSRRTTYPRRKAAWKEPYQNQFRWQCEPFDDQFHEQKGEQCDALSVHKEKEPWQYDSTTETKVDDEIYIDECIQSREHWGEFTRRDKCHPETKYTPKQNTCHPEPFGENKYVPKVDKYHREPHETVQPFDNRNLPWSHQSKNIFNHVDQFRRNNQYRNRRADYNKNNFNQGNRFRSSHFFRQNTRNIPRYRQQTRDAFQNSHPRNYYQNRTRMLSSLSPNSSNSPNETNQEVLFTRRDKFNYKANVGDFDDCTDQQRQQSLRRNFCCHAGGNICHQLNVENYETNVAKKIRSDKTGENSFTWGNNRSFDFVPFDANKPIETSPPWNSDNSNTIHNPRINAISRRQMN